MKNNSGNSLTGLKPAARLVGVNEKKDKDCSITVEAGTTGGGERFCCLTQCGVEIIIPAKLVPQAIELMQKFLKDS